jgi:hypothetical protein
LELNCAPTAAPCCIFSLTPVRLIARGTAPARTLAEKLLVLMTLGDERAVSQTYVLGRLQCPPPHRAQDFRGVNA